jgi:hypothetical protein
MMDFYSNFPPPSREEAIKEVVKKVIVDYPDFDSDKLLKITTKVVKEMPSLGSYTGWYVSFQKDAIQLVIDEIKNDCNIESNAEQITLINE